MRLYSIQYTEYADRPYRWVLDEFTLININLIVGRNAVGKSRILRLINGLARLVEGTIAPAKLATGYYKAVFKDPSTKTKYPDVVYELEIFEGKVKLEKLYVGESLKLDRNESGRGSVWFSKEETFIDIQVPSNSLAVAARRDAIQHPFFEQLYDWATAVRLCDFAAPRVHEGAIVDKNIKWEMVHQGTPIFENIQVLFKLGKERFGRDLISPVISNMRKLGYEISDLGLMPLTGVGPIPSETPEVIYVREDGIDKKLPQREISAGMFRAIALLIQLQMIQLDKKPACVLIDDIGEGLDFERSKGIIAIVIGMAEKGHSQFLMTTNDRFVMNNVPLDYWCAIEREGGQVRTYTPRNSSQTFKDFEEFGFNNFDFFAKGFFAKSIKNDKA